MIPYKYHQNYRMDGGIAIRNILIADIKKPKIFFEVALKTVTTGVSI